MYSTYLHYLLTMSTFCMFADVLLNIRLDVLIPRISSLSLVELTVLENVELVKLILEAEFRLFE